MKRDGRIQEIRSGADAADYPSVLIGSLTNIATDFVDFWSDKGLHAMRSDSLSIAEQ